MMFEMVLNERETTVVRIDALDEGARGVQIDAPEDIDCIRNELNEALHAGLSLLKLNELLPRVVSKWLVLTPAAVDELRAEVHKAYPTEAALIDAIDRDELRGWLENFRPTYEPQVDFDVAVQRLIEALRLHSNN